MRLLFSPAAEDDLEAIADYIDLFDACLKQYFSELDNPAAAIAHVDARYGAYLGAHDIIL